MHYVTSPELDAGSRCRSLDPPAMQRPAAARPLPRPPQQKQRRRRRPRRPTHRHFQPNCEELARRGGEAAGVSYSREGPLASSRFSMTPLYEPTIESVAALHRALRMQSSWHWLPWRRPRFCVPDHVVPCSRRFSFSKPIKGCLPHCPSALASASTVLCMPCSVLITGLIGSLSFLN